MTPFRHTTRFAKSSYRLARSFYPQTRKLFLEHFEWRITGRWMLYSAVVGLVGALGAIVFAYLVSTATDFFLLRLIGYEMPFPGGELEKTAAVFDLAGALKPTHRWLLFIIPTLGGLLSGWLVFTFAPEAEGHGTDAVIRAFHKENSLIRPRVALIKTLASAITLGTGGSAGREGPIAQIGATLASALAQRIGLSEQERRILLVSGIAAGIGSIFRSPLGGAFFAVEVLYRQDLESEALMPAVVSSIIGYSIYSNIMDSSTVFTTPEFKFVNPVELLPLIVFALLCAVVGLFYVQFFYGTKQNVFDRLQIPRFLKPALGGLLVGAIAFFFPAILSSSYGWLQLAINGQLPMVIMIVLALTKIIATSLTIGSGGSGGVFAPTLVIGGMLGGIFGVWLNALSPTLVTQPEAYVMIGMATFFTGVANVPISTTIMISEMTGRYTLLVPLIFASVLVHLMIRRWSLYKEQVRTYNDSPAHRDAGIQGALSSIRVRSVINHPVYFHTLSASHTLNEILDVFTRTREVILPVESQDETAPERYDGLVLLDDIQSLLRSDELPDALVVAHDVAVPFAAVNLEDTLDTVMEAFEKTGYPELPVLDEEGEIVGFIRQGQIISEYHRASLRIKRQQPDA